MFLVTCYYKSDINTFTKHIESCKTYSSAQFKCNKLLSDYYKLITADNNFDNVKFLSNDWEIEDVNDIKNYIINKKIQSLNMKDKINKYREFSITIEEVTE